MAFAEHDDMIQTLPPNCSDHPLHERVLPGRFSARDHFPNSHVLNTPAKVAPVDPIAVSNEELRDRAVAGESLNHLLGCPFGAGI